MGVAILFAAVAGGLLTVAVGAVRMFQLRRAAKKNLKAGRSGVSRIDTSSSTESAGSSPSTDRGDRQLFSVMPPLWLSRNAVSAASRPVAMRTIVCRGARHVASTTRHWPSTNASATAWKSIG